LIYNVFFPSGLTRGASEPEAWGMVCCIEAGTLFGYLPKWQN
jgi:hypothetical protein